MTKQRLFAVGVFLFAAHLIASALADGTTPEIVVSINEPKDTSFERAASAGAAAVVFRADEPATVTPELLSRLSAQAKKHGLKLWLGIAFPERVPRVNSTEIEGVALLFLPSTGNPLPKTDFAGLLARERKGVELVEAIRHVKKGLGAKVKLAICTDLSEIAPETSRNQFVPVRNLIHDGTVDLVCLRGAEGFNFHRLRLLRATPLRAGMLVGGKAIQDKAAGGIIARSVLAALKNDTCECLWLFDLPIELLGHIIPDTIKGYNEAIAQQETIQEAIQNGNLVIDQEVDAKKCNDQATVHGVGQSFIPSRDGLCPLIQIYAAIRGCKGKLPPPLKVSLRINDQDMPGGGAYADTTIPASAFGHEPTYRWVNAYFDPPVELKKDQKYWIYLPKASYPEGTYVWRIIKNGATERGNAWSGRYNYGNHTWVFRVYLKKK
ncbi:MAG: hypothetical protein GXP25_07025 [Planctomycetes bacterium]|nr:hypothetical protein [Planctomycetota bacterium]